MKIKIITISIVSMLVMFNIVVLFTTYVDADENQPQWPTSWILIDTDPTENGPSDDYRDVQYVYYNFDNNYLYFRLQCYGSPSFTQEPECRYKWFIDIDNPHNLGTSGGNVYEAEFLFFIEDSPKPGGDGIGDIYLLEDLDNDGEIGDDWPDYLNTPGPILNSSIADYRIEGNCMDLYISLANITNPEYSYFTWATDQEDPNLDSAPNIDRSNNFWNTDLSKADLSIVKSDSADPVYPGDSFSYTLLVTNHGPHAALNVNITDELPTIVTLNSINPVPTGGSFPTFYWNVPLLDIGESYQILIDVSLEDNTTGVIYNTATVYNDTRDPIPGNNVDIEETTIENTANLAIIKSDSNDPVLPGESFTYTLQVQNLGPNNADNVVIYDNLPTGLIFKNSVPPPSGSSDSTYFWNISYFEEGDSIEIIIDVEVDIVPPGVVTNSGHVYSDTPDLYSENNIASEDTTIGSAVDLSITKFDSNDPVYPGESFSYTLQVTNNGPDIATDVNISDALPEELLFVSANPSPSGNSESLYWWSFSSIGAGDSENIIIDVIVNSNNPDTITNSAQATCDVYDLNSENNIVFEDTTIESAADLVIIKSDNIDPVISGNNLTYVIEISNNGPNTAENVVVRDALPPEVTFVNAVPSPSGNSDNDYWWDIPILEIGEIVEIIVNVTVNNGTMGIIFNNVEVTSNTHDLILNNNQYTEETSVKGVADLSIHKTSDVSGTIYAGDSIKYSLNVTNHGPDIALNVNVFDVRPTGVTYVNANPLPSGNNGSTYWWTIPYINVGESIYIDIYVTVNDGFVGVISNVAYVDEDSHDPDDDNNQDNEDITVEEDSAGGGSPGGVNPNPGSGNNKPTAIANGPYYGSKGEVIQFDGAESHDNDEGGQSIVRFDWKFFDDDVWYENIGATPTYIYHEPGVYNVTLLVYDDEGGTDIDITTAIIVQLNHPPSFPEITGPMNGTQNTTLTYYVTSIDEDGDPISFILDWDDGTSDTYDLPPGSFELYASHAWSEAGIYIIFAEAHDNETTSGPAMLTVLIDVLYVKDIGYLIDNESDGTYDWFYSNSTNKNTYTEKRKDGKYLINSDSDDGWDWIYDPEDDILEPYIDDGKGAKKADNTPWFLLLFLLILLFIILYYLAMKRKKKDESEKPKKKGKKTPVKTK